MKKYLLGGAAAVLAYFATLYFLSYQNDNIMRATPEPAGPHRYVIYNTKDFERAAGAQAMSISTLQQLGASNVKQMEYINGASFEAQEGAKVFAIAQTSDWVIQPEQTHSILQWSCNRCQTIPCPVEGTPIPKCPSPPGAGPCGPGPIDPPPPPIEADKSWGRARVEAAAAQQIVDTSQVKVAIVDDGIDMNHPNKGNVVGTVSFTGEAVSPGGGHGAHTAGTVAGTGGIGISKAKLYICKGLSNNGSGSSSMLSQCLMWAGQQGVSIVSNSWGSPQSDPMINQAIASLTAKGIAVVVSNGNDGRGTLNWPAQLSINNPLVFGSAASDRNDNRATFSTYGPGTKFISPGVDIVSNQRGGGTVTMSGTSMSAPHLSGIIAFCIARGLPPTCVKSSGAVGGYPFASAKLTAAQ